MIAVREPGGSPAVEASPSLASAEKSVFRWALKKTEPSAAKGADDERR
jgi:hypothetical protein